MAPTITSALTIVLTTVPMLGKDNWAKFGKGFKVFLLGVDTLWVMGKGPKADESDQVALDRMLLPYLYTKIEEQYQPLLDDFESATATWAALKAHFEKSSMSTRMAARAELHSIPLLVMGFGLDHSLVIGSHDHLIPSDLITDHITDDI
ncbi:unnamed protein product [Mycena citricolor]|uniref:Uncharacterized protein n=1 Tax=Mycena citricolor TaxID=2018698 RepID=A0AAD2K0G2_9AGAR|nr:unnamed protein product [Mycena citricolor]